MPDLSRSVPTTPGSNHKLSLATSYDSVLEEPENNQQSKNRKKSKAKSKMAQYFFSDQSVQLRRKSEEFILGDGKSPSQHKPPNNKSSVHRTNVTGSSADRGFVSLQVNHMRQNSEPSSNQNRFIPVRVQLKKKSPLTNIFTSMGGRQTKLNAGKSVPSLYSIESSNDNTPNGSPSKTKPIRNSASFTADLGSAQFSTYTIPRVSLSTTKGVSVDVLKQSDDNKDSHA